MELKRVISVYEMNRNNFLLYLFYLISKFFIAYITFKRTHEFFYWIFTKMQNFKNSRFLFLFSDAIFILINLFEIFLFYYIVSLTSFLNLRQGIFEYINFNFSTNSNLRDLESFKTFYCNTDSIYYKDLHSNNNNLSDVFSQHHYNNHENSKIELDIIKIQNIKTNFCFLNSFFDGFYLENSLLFLMISNMLFKNFRKYLNKTYKGFSMFYKIFFVILAIMQILYFSIIYIQLAKLRGDYSNRDASNNSKGNGNISHNEIYLNNYKSYDMKNYQEYDFSNASYTFDNSNLDSYNEIENNNNDMQDETVINSTSKEGLSIWRILGEVLAFIGEILAD